MRNRFIGCLLFILACTGGTCYAYRISGTLRNTGCYAPKVYLEVINDIDGIYGANAANIIATAIPDSSGNFMLAGIDLPDDFRLYRLSMAEEGKTSQIITGSQRNYMLLAMNNQAELVIQCDNFCHAFFNYSVSASIDNHAIIQLQNVLYTYDSLDWTSIGATRKQFVQAKRRNQLKQFADTTNGLLAALWAVELLQPEQTYFTDQAFFDRFAKRFAATANAPSYAHQLSEQFRYLELKKVGYTRVPLNAFLLVCTLLGASIVVNIMLLAKKRTGSLSGDKLNDAVIPIPVLVADKETVIKGLIEKLTIKEREILKMVHEGLSNKEIAEQLHVEVSTIKTHISNIYQKTEIKNRKEVAGIARFVE